MTAPRRQPYRHTPAELADAVAASTSWRGVLRALDRPSTSAGAMRAVRRQVESLAIDHSHFTGRRRWSDRALAHAVAEATTWNEVSCALGLADSGSAVTTLRGHALRLGLDVSHLGLRRPPVGLPFHAAPRITELRSAAGSLAAAWFQLRGYSVLWPQEPCRYDVVVCADGAFHRIQVKSATYRANGRIEVTIAGTHQDKRAPYDIDDVDHFFIVDVNLDAYLIPIAVVAGYRSISLGAYGEYRVATRGQWLEDRSPLRGS